MKIWKLWEDVNNYDSLMAKDSNFEHEFEALNGCSLIEGWEPIELKRMYGEGLPLSDYPYFFGRPVMSDKAISALDSIIRDSVEYLSLAFEEKNYTMVNITKIFLLLFYYILHKEMLKLKKLKVHKDNLFLIYFPDFNFLIIDQKPSQDL